MSAGLWRAVRVKIRCRRCVTALQIMTAQIHFYMGINKEQFEGGEPGRSWSSISKFASSFNGMSGFGTPEHHRSKMNTETQVVFHSPPCCCLLWTWNCIQILSHYLSANIQNERGFSSFDSFDYSLLESVQTLSPSIWSDTSVHSTSLCV